MGCWDNMKWFNVHKTGSKKIFEEIMTKTWQVWWKTPTVNLKTKRLKTYAVLSDKKIKLNQKSIIMRYLENLSVFGN